MSLIEKNVSLEFITRVLSPERKLIPALIFDLKEKGLELAGEIPQEKYRSMQEFFNAHDLGHSGFAALEGRGMRFGNIFSLTSCPFHPMKLFLLNHTTKRLPAFYEAVEDAYNKVYDGKTAIMNPLCILHQTARRAVARNISIGGSPLVYRHIASRSELTGKRIFADEGIAIAERMDCPRGRVEELLNECTCLYLLKSPIES